MYLMWPLLTFLIAQDRIKEENLVFHEGEKIMGRMNFIHPWRGCLYFGLAPRWTIFIMVIAQHWLNLTKQLLPSKLGPRYILIHFESVPDGKIRWKENFPLVLESRMRTSSMEIFWQYFISSCKITNSMTLVKTSNLFFSSFKDI